VSATVRIAWRRRRPLTAAATANGVAPSPTQSVRPAKSSRTPVNPPGQSCSPNSPSGTQSRLAPPRRHPRGLPALRNRSARRSTRTLAARARSLARRIAEPRTLERRSRGRQRRGPSSLPAVRPAAFAAARKVRPRQLSQSEPVHASPRALVITGELSGGDPQAVRHTWRSWASGGSGRVARSYATPRLLAWNRVVRGERLPSAGAVPRTPAGGQRNEEADERRRAQVAARQAPHSHRLDLLHVDQHRLALASTQRRSQSWSLPSSTRTTCLTQSHAAHAGIEVSGRVGPGRGR